MCGITGFVDFGRGSSEEQLRRMQQTLLHRGPDDNGVSFESFDSYSVGLAHTRLSIIDVSPLGHQPMVFQQYSIVYNGEIYNFQEIRVVLVSKGHQFVTNSDTEVILHAFKEWGINCVDHFIGMFAFCLYDRQDEKIYLCRDRVGVKPLFYYWVNGLFMFASEIKAFFQHSSFDSDISIESIPLYLQYGYVAGPKTIYKNVQKVDPGSWLVMDMKTRKHSQVNYWQIKKIFTSEISHLTYNEAKSELEGLLISACQYRMVADVPVGIFLSGGFDSTIVTAMLQHNTTQKLKTFTIGFPGGTDEAPFAKQVADFLGTDHTTYNCTEEDAKQIIPELAYYFDEPISDVSVIPTILVSRLARKQVTVAISADGGDELFAGYDAYQTAVARLKYLNAVPVPGLVGKLAKFASGLLPQGQELTRLKLKGLGEVLTSKPEFGKSLAEQSSDIPKTFIEKFIPNVSTFRHPIFETDWSDFTDERNTFLYNSFEGALKDYLLVKVDRATMAASLEGREPLLDHRLIEFAAALPFDFKQSTTTSKRIIKDITYDYVPREIMDRPKCGFDLPLYKWLRNELSSLVFDLVEDKEFFSMTNIDQQVATEFLKNFMHGRNHYPQLVWRLVFLRLWLRKWKLN